MEQIIDDWVLMGFLVGNDFMPHLPNMHIHQASSNTVTFRIIILFQSSHTHTHTQDALPFLYRKYKEVLPTLDGEQ